MALNFGPIVSGPYKAAWNATDLGFTVEGYRLAIRYMKEMIQQSDQYGETLIDSIHRGAKADFSYESQVYDANGIGVVCPYGSLGVIMSNTKPIGITDRANAKSLVLTATANTPAATSPATLSAPLTTLSDNFDVGWLYSSTARKIPVKLLTFPVESGTVAGTLQFFGMT